MAWLTGWNYRKAVTLSNTGSTLIDYQVLITTDTATLISAGKMRSDCGDIRFTDTDGSTLLNYWIESGQNTVSTKIWVKIPSVPTSKTIYLYYGNSSVTSVSNGTNTFVFFDDFLGTSLGAVWTFATAYGAPTIAISGSTAYINSSGNTYASLYTTSIIGINVIQRIRAKWWGTIVGCPGRPWIQTGFYDGTTANIMDSSNSAGLLLDCCVSANPGYSIGSSKAGSKLYAGGNTTLLDNGANWHISELTWSSNLVKGLFDATVIGSITDTTKIPVSATLRNGISIFKNYMEIDWITVRKYASPEPTILDISLEQTSANITVTNMIITPSETPCRVGICTVSVDVTWTNTGGSSGDFIPNITIDGTPYSSPYPLESLGAGLSVTKTFVISGLIAMTHAICPYPN